MTARAAGEEHRGATPLELFFDLCFVVAVGQAARAFEHELAEGHVGHGLLGYALVFFAIWWAWMNFTWFASAYDTDDVPYRLLILVQITGALIMAAGVAEALRDYDFTVPTWGYVVMRLAMVPQWLRAARADPERRRACRRYAVGIVAVQSGWLARLAVPGDWALAAFAALIVAELAIPLWAEHAARTTWHPHHIAERYGLFTLIVLGESLTAATAAVRSALDDDAAFGDIAAVTVGGLLTVFAMWWLYFAQNAPGRLASPRMAFWWGYGHYAVFASAAAVGAGLALNVGHVTGHGHLTDHGAGAAYTVPAAVFVTVVWVLHHRAGELRGAAGLTRPLAVAAILAATFTPEPVLFTGLVAAALVTAVLIRPARAAPATVPAPPPE
jgi:low temperature requirement protein LtrA